MVVSGKNTMELIIAARDRTGGAFNKVTSRVGKLGGVSKKVTAALKGAAKAGALVGAAAVVAGIVSSTKAFMDFEDAMANVRKTTGFTKEQIGVLGEAINALALKIPVAQTELAGIAAVAGQLGITGQKSILEFTKTVAKMSTAFDMSAEAAAIAMAKMANIYDIPIEKVSALGSAINALGNTTAAQESAIMDFAMSLGASAKMLGFNETESVAMGASLISMGMDASAAGTRLNSAFTQMGKNVTEIAAFLDMTEAEFKAAFGEDPMNMLIRITEKLSLIEDPLERNTVAAETFGLIGAKAINNLGANIDGLKTNLKTAAVEFEKDVSLTEEFAAKTDTLKARFQLLKNSISSLLIDIGGELAPTLNLLIEGFRNILPAVKEVLFEIGVGFKEHFESIARQAGPALDPLIAKVEEAGEKMSSGLNFKTLLDDIGVFIGAGLNPLIRGFTWLIDKLGPLWDLIGKGAEAFHNLANALKTEEGRIDDILDATEKLTEAKQDLFDINEKLRGNVKTLSESLSEAGGWTTTLADLEADASLKTLALAGARIKATEAIATHGAESEIAITAIENVKIAEEAATSATNDFNTAVGIASQAIIDEGVATEGLEQAQLDFTISTEEATTKQEELQTAVIDLEKELEEAKEAPLNLGESFKAFGKKVAAIFLEIPLKVAEAILKTQEIIAGGLDKIGLGSFAKNLDSDTENIKAKIESIRKKLETDIEDPLSKDIPKASEEMKEAVTDSINAIVTSVERVKEGAEEVTTVIIDAGKAAEDAGSAGEDGFKQIEIAVDKATGKVTVLTDNLGDTADMFDDNADAAQTLLDLDWNVFTKLENSLPNINSGIGNMTNAFKGLENILKANIENLESVRESVKEINKIAAPFVTEGFQDGITGIDSFARSLKDASSAINDFSSLQDVSIKGMINFSLHVNDMVSALQILESQMEDLEPLFSSLNSLVGDMTENFVYSGDKITDFSVLFSDALSGTVDDFDAIGVGISKSTDALDAFYEGEKKRVGGWAAWKEKHGTYQVPTGWEGPAVGIGPAAAMKAAAEKLEFEKTNIQSLNDFINDMVAATTITWTQGNLTITRAIEDRASAVATLDSIMSSASSFKTDFIATSLGTLDLTTFNTTIADGTKNLQKYMKSTYGVTISTEEMFAVMAKPPEEQQKWFEEQLHTNEAITFQWNKQTAAIEANGEKLKQLTDAMQPQLEFMRTLNELAALSTLSIADLNSGLDAITNTLGNLSTALSTFDLRSVMESLFGEMSEAEDGLDSAFKGGAASGFMKVMQDYEWKFSILIGYITRLSFAITNLVSAFDALANVGDSVLADQKKIKEVFESIITTMSNFSNEMSKSGFGEKIAKGFEEMLTSAAPLIRYFKENNAGIIDFNTTLLTFKTTLSNVIDTMNVLKEMSEMVLPSIEELGTGFDRAKGFIDSFDDALMRSIGVTRGDKAFTYDENGLVQSYEDNIYDIEKMFDNVFTSIMRFADDWKLIEEKMGDSFKTFAEGSSIITGMINNVLSLSAAFTALGNSTVVSTKDMERAMRNLDVFIGRFTKVMASGLGYVVGDLKALDIEWQKYSKDMEDLMPSFKDATSDISTLITTVTSLNTAFKTLSETSITSSAIFDKGFTSLIGTIKNFAVSLSKNVGPMIESLKELRRIWIENENVLVPLMQDFIIITKNLKSVADAANNMTASFRNINSGWVLLERGFDRLVEFIKTTVTAIKEFYTPEAAAEVSAFITDIGTVIESFEELNSKIENALNDIKTKIGNAINDIERKISSLDNLKSSMFTSGANLIQSFINGINSMQALLETALIRIANTIKAYLGVSSPTELGALKDLEKWPRNLVQSFSKGIEAEMGNLNVSLGSMVAPVFVSGGSSEGDNKTSVNFTIHQTIKDRATADYSNRELEKLLKRHIPK